MLPWVPCMQPSFSAWAGQRTAPCHTTNAAFQGLLQEKRNVAFTNAGQQQRGSKP